MAHTVELARWLVTAPVVLALAACGPTPKPESAGPPSPTTSATSPGTPSAPSPSPTPAPTALPVAADGTRLDACGDGNCEVTVVPSNMFKLDRGSGVMSIAVSSIEEDQVVLLIPVAGGPARFSCDVPITCEVTVIGASASAPASGQFTVRPGARFTVSQTQFEVVAVAQKQSVLRIARA